MDRLELQVYEENQEYQGKMAKLDNLVLVDKRWERLLFEIFVILQGFFKCCFTDGIVMYTIVDSMIFNMKFSFLT